MLSEDANFTILLLCGGLLGLLIGVTVVLRSIKVTLDVVRSFLPWLCLFNNALKLKTRGILDKLELKSRWMLGKLDFVPRWEMPAYIAVGGLFCSLVSFIYLSPVRLGWLPLIGGIIVGLLSAYAVLCLAAASVFWKILSSGK